MLTKQQRNRLSDGDRVHWSPPEPIADTSDSACAGTVQEIEGNENCLQIAWDDGTGATIPRHDREAVQNFWSRVTLMAWILILIPPICRADDPKDLLRPGDEGWIESYAATLDSLPKEHLKRRTAQWTGKGFQWKRGAWVLMHRPKEYKGPVPHPRTGRRRGSQITTSSGHVFHWIAPDKTLLLKDFPKGQVHLTYFTGSEEGHAGLLVRPAEIQTSQPGDN